MSWLSAHLHDPEVVVLDATMPVVGVVPVVDTKARYRERHIPGAVFFDIEAVSDQTTTLPHMLPPAEVFARSMEALGVGDAMCAVVYEQEGVFSAPRAWWMLRAMGMRRVYVLDGGLRAWMEAGLPVEAGTVTRPQASFHAVLDEAAVRSFVQVQEMLGKAGQQILDARSSGRFAGTAPEPRAGLRSGHMPGAVNVPYTEVVKDGRLRDADALLNGFKNCGVDVTRPITTSCGSGITAAVLALALERCNAADVSLYDGSWTEYAQRPEAVIVSEA